MSESGQFPEVEAVRAVVRAANQRFFQTRARMYELMQASDADMF